MASEVQLDDVAEIIMGQSPPGSTYNESGIGLPFFQGVRDFNYRYPSIRVFCSEPSRIAQPGDILFSVRAPIGRVNIAEVECAIGRGLSIIRAREQSDREYIEFVLRSMERQWEFIEGGGSVFGNATRRDLETLPLPWPDNALEREAIACILGVLDDKIELNRRMNETLEAMARAIFKSWFVDFDPVRAKAEGQQPPGLAPHIADLFPDAFEESELGEIPKGWGITNVGTMAKVTSGKRPPARFSEPTDDARVPLWGGNGPMAFVSEPLYQNPILLTGRVGTLGSVFRITTPCWPSDNTLVAMARNDAAYEFLYFQLQHVDYLSLNRGSTQPLLTQTDLKSQRFVIPHENLMEQFHKVVGSVFERIDASQKESRTLAALRDTLLPRLISGELRVPDAERIVGRCV